jgi:predicted dehydrogenase
MSASKLKPVGVGVIGCGKISDIYFKTLGDVLTATTVVGCADLDMARAKEKAAEYGIEAMTVDALLADERIEIILNITVPKAHFEVAVKAVEAGKSVYNEKPLVLTRDEGKALLDAATAKGVLVGCAPDTFLGAGIQTCRKMIDDGWIGTPVSATAFMMGHGPESWHPSPEFYYQVGGGPLFDMGPYYLTALINLVGPVKAVSARAGKALDQRTITSQPKFGKVVDVEIPTHVAGTLDFDSGVIATMIMSFDVWKANMPFIEIHGTDGSLSVPNPNTFGGPVRLFRPGMEGWSDVPLVHPMSENARGLGVADMACAIRNSRPHRANGEMAHHLVDVMHALHDASDANAWVDVATTCERPEPLPLTMGAFGPTA